MTRATSGRARADEPKADASPSAPGSRRPGPRCVAGRSRVPTDPFDPNAIRAETAADRTADLVARPRVRRADLALTFAPAIATSVDPLLHGRRYFPRMLEDIAAAKDHVHLLIYGYKPGDIGETFLEALSAKVAAGVEVRLAVDAIGSEIDFGSKDLYRRLLRRRASRSSPMTGSWSRGRARSARASSNRTREDLLHFDHRKMVVVDGRVGYVGGSGIEDHYNDERFYDVMCRVEGPIVAQLAAVFLISWRNNDGAAAGRSGARPLLPADDAAGRPRRPPLQAPTTVLWNVPGTGHHPISDTIERALEDAAHEIHIVNPYISNRAILERIHAAALRGVRVRLIAPGKPTPPYPAAAFRHWYGRLIDAGVEILLHPEMAHAKVLRIDDQVLDRRLQPGRPVALPQRRARPAVRGSGRGRADRARHLRRARRDVDARGRPDRRRGIGPGTPRWTASRGSSSQSAGTSPIPAHT